MTPFYLGLQVIKSFFKTIYLHNNQDQFFKKNEASLAKAGVTAPPFKYEPKWKKDYFPSADFFGAKTAQKNTSTIGNRKRKRK